jgi:hypothetical protein
MAWLVTNGRVLASADVLTSLPDRARGLLGKKGIDGAVVIERCRWIHTIGMRFAIDVAYLDRNNTVIRIATVRPNRVPAPVMRARRAVEAEAGAMARWGLQAGDVIEIRN